MVYNMTPITSHLALSLNFHSQFKMNDSTPINFKDVDVSRISFSKPLEVKVGDQPVGKRVFLNYDHPTRGIQNLVIKSPTVLFQFGLSPYTIEGNTSWSLSARDVSGSAYVELMAAIDERVIEYLIRESPILFGTKKSKAAVEEALYEKARACRIGVNKKSGETYPATAKFRFPVYKNDVTGDFFPVQVYDKDRKELSVSPRDSSSPITRGSRGRVISKCSLFFGSAAVAFQNNASMVLLTSSGGVNSSNPFSDHESDDDQVVVNPSGLPDVQCPSGDESLSESEPGSASASESGSEQDSDSE